MFDAIKPLLDSGILNEAAKTQLEEAWNAKITEARAEVTTELRAEFAGRYEHDKNVMVEALDRLVTETLSAEIEKIQEEKNQLIADRAKFMSEMKKNAGKFEKFIAEQLKKELVEFAKDRKMVSESTAKLEKFVMRALAEEISEFAADKKDLVETKVKLVAESKQKLAALQKQFVARGAKLVEATVTNSLKAELGQLKEDIKVARENNFGRRLFEAFAGEFSATHLNENAEIRKLRSIMTDMEHKLVEAKTVAAEKAALVESKTREITQIKNGVARDSKLNEMLKPLASEKRAVMASLLESVSTEKLEAAFNKYLPAVINGAPKSGRKVINESVAKTGNRVANAQDESDASNIVEIKRLAGLK